ncbi:hypothetical protein VPNG_05003 [Cytospora leucostoma]|uniref:3beta-hydroxysteroid 3-dehydrogenase n=1 Tax=Cytospora leucostoma TaxID=1230097 RepID=A0A423X7H7_9PEZI|nr:hypothetical protein VPNG_05003 [Cytospora leucostoma]
MTGGDERTVLVTGANGGLGLAIVSKLLAIQENPPHVICTVRKEETATALKSLLQSLPISKRGRCEVVSLDLSRLDSARQVAGNINARVAAGSLPRIEALILNAGYQEQYTHDFTNDGFDMSFQCNYLSHWLLTLQLLKSIDKDHGRVVVVGSWSHDPYDSRNDSMGAFIEDKWKTLFHDTESLAKGTWSLPTENPSKEPGYRRYGASKLCEIMMIYELQERLDKDSKLSKVAVIGVDPGGMVSGLTRRGNAFLVFAIQRVLPLFVGILNWFSPNGMFRTTTKSATDVVAAAYEALPAGRTPKGLYLNGSEPGDTSKESKDPEKRHTLWRDSIRYTGLTAEDTELENWQ